MLIKSAFSFWKTTFFSLTSNIHSIIECFKNILNPLFLQIKSEKAGTWLANVDTIVLTMFFILILKVNDRNNLCNILIHIVNFSPLSEPEGKPPGSVFSAGVDLRGFLSSCLNYNY